MDSWAIPIIAVIFAAAALSAWVFQWLKLPTVLGFILTGILMGPGGLNLLRQNQIHLLAEVGIIFLLFLVGLELSWTKLRQFRFQAPVAGALQLALTTLALTAFLAFGLQIPLQLAFLLGSTLSISSTAIVLKSLEEQGEMDTVHARLILGILIIQDLAIVPLMTLTPTLMQPFSSDILMTAGWITLKAIVFSAVAVMGSLFVLPKVLDRMASTNRKEIFILAVAAIILGVAWLTNAMGLSFEAGAMIAGLSLSGSIYAHQIFADSRSYRDIFSTLFFVSMGLWADWRVIEVHWLLILGVAFAIAAIKIGTGFIAVRLSGFSKKISLWTALGLFQAGEFSFILMGKINETVAQVPAWHVAMKHWGAILIHAAILLMFVTPLVLKLMPVIMQALMKRGWLSPSAASKPQSLAHTDEADEDYCEAPVLIAGYGPVAQQLTRVLRLKNICYLIVELNPNTIKFLQQQGEPCLYGDITHPDILAKVGIERARLLAITIPDLRSAQTTVQQAKKLNPELCTIVRCRYNRDVDYLYELGADLVIQEEMETSLLFQEALLAELHVPAGEIDDVLAKSRQEDEQRRHFRHLDPTALFGRIQLVPGTRIEWVELSNASPLIGKSLTELNLRQETGVNVLAVMRQNHDPESPVAADHVFQPHEVLVAMGTLTQLQALERLVSGH